MSAAQTLLALSYRVPPCWRGHGEPSRLDGSKLWVPLRGCILVDYERLLYTLCQPSHFHVSHSEYLPLASSQRRGNYDTFRYLPINERSLFSFFCGPLDISFKSSV
jgi:hypothetical protein